MSLGSRLRKLRKENEMTLEDFAKKFNVGKSTTSEYESDKIKPSYDLMKKFSEYYNVSTDYLLGLTDDPDIYEKKKEWTKDELMDILDEGLIKDFSETKIKKIKFVADTALDDISLEDLRMAVYAIRQAKKDSQ